MTISITLIVNLIAKNEVSDINHFMQSILRLNLLKAMNFN